MDKDEIVSTNSLANKSKAANLLDKGIKLSPQWTEDKMIPSHKSKAHFDGQRIK